MKWQQSSPQPDAGNPNRRAGRSTNLLDRSLSEVKRRTKVMGRFPGGPAA